MLAIADDLTGALEVGAKFSAHGLGATVLTEIPGTLTQRCLPVILDLETRHVPAEVATARTRHVATLARDSGVPLIYKKTDSTLRGNIGAELRALAEIFPEQRITYVPAYPDLGRTVRKGRLYVDGKPVHETAFAHDPLSPVRDCQISSVLGDVTAQIVDAECNLDVELAARAILERPGPHICAGPAALASALGVLIGHERSTSPAFPPVWRCLVINGSLHPASLEQMKRATETGILDQHWKAFDLALCGSGRERAVQVGHHVRRILDAEPFDAIVVFGGDTAFGIHQALGSAPFNVIDEVLPGVPISRSGDLLWVTKAGGFGPSDILAQIRVRLS